MGLMSGIGRLLLVIINLVFLLLGLGLLGGGLFLRFGQKLYEPAVTATINILKEVGKKVSNTYEFNDSEIGNMLMSLSIGLIVGGIILVGLTIFGCCGGCYKIKCMLFLYGIILLVLLVAQIIVIGLLYGKNDIIKQPLKDGLKDYKGLSGTDLLSVGWNLVMIQFQCCGVDSYKDFNNGNGWQNITYGTFGTLTLNSPIACCKILPPTTAKDLDDCAGKTIDETTSNRNIGCFKVIWDISLGNIPIAVSVLVACGVFQIILIVFSYIIYKSDEKVGAV